jgi:hypothetical protein
MKKLFLIFVICASAGMIFKRFYPTEKECILIDTVYSNITVIKGNEIFEFRDTTRFLIKETKYYYVNKKGTP